MLVILGKRRGGEGVEVHWLGRHAPVCVKALDAIKLLLVTHK